MIEARAAETAIMTGRVDWQRQPLMGLPVSIKSSIDVKGMPSRNGDPSFTDCIATADSTVVQKIREAGGIVLAKTRMPFRASAFESDCIFGRANNPYDLSRTPGGSSGGEGALVAAGGSPLGIATDGGGSILVPASYTGLAGIVPANGRVSNAGLGNGHNAEPDPVWNCTIGPMARSVDDLVLALRVIIGPDYRDAFSFPASPLGDHRKIDLRSLRIAFWTGDDFLHPTKAVREAFDAAVDTLKERGAKLTQVAPFMDLKKARQIMVAFVHPDALKWNLAGIKEAGDQGAFFTRWTQRIADLLEEIPPAERGALASQFPRLRSSVLKSMEGYDAILTPSFSCPALPHGGTADGETDGVRSICYPLFMRFVSTFPIGTVRCGTAEGLPVGLQVTGDRYQEEKTPGDHARRGKRLGRIPASTGT